MVRTKNLTPSDSSQQSEPHSPPPTKRRKLTPRSKAKVQPKPQSKPKEKGVVIKEPVVTRAQSKKSASTGRGKSTKSPSPPHSDSSTPSFTPKPPKKPKYDEKTIRAMTGLLEGAFEEGLGKSKKGQSSKKPEPEVEITRPPKGFNVGKLEESQKYLTQFSKRKVCKTHRVDLKILQEVLKYNLSPFLEPYMPWLSINLPFSTKVITHFYCNLEIIDEPNRTSAEEEMTTRVRGQEILISPSRINNWLGIEDPPDDISSQLEPNQIFSVLRPGELVGPLNFNPSDMCDLHRVLWYIYSRSLVNKANNFTKFSNLDYRLFTSLLLKEQKDLGEYIFSEMQRYRIEGKVTTPMPYPQIISLILQKNKIWYLENKEPIERITPVGKNQIGKLGIEIPLKSPLESGPRKKKTEAETSRMDDTQSSAPAATTSAPSFLNATLQTFMQNMLKEFHIDISNTNAELVTHMNHKMTELVDRMDKRHEEMLAEQRAQGELLRSIVARLDSMGSGPSSAGPSYVPEPTSPPEHISVEVNPIVPETSIPTVPETSIPIPPPESHPSDPEPSAPKTTKPEPSTPIIPTGDILYSVTDPKTNETTHIILEDSPPTAQPEPESTPVPSPTHTEEISPTSSGHHSPTATEEVEFPSSAMVVYQPPPIPPRDDIQVPPLNLPSPESSSSSFHTSSPDDSTGSLVIPVKPISAAKPPSPPLD